MGCDQIAVIRPSICELFAAAAQGNGNLCVTFTANGLPDVWLQVTAESVNFAYPHPEEPQAFLTQKGVVIPSSLTWDAFEAGLYATLAHKCTDPVTVASLTDQILTAIHGLDTDQYEIDVEMEYL